MDVKEKRYFFSWKQETNDWFASTLEIVGNSLSKWFHLDSSIVPLFHHQYYFDVLLYNQNFRLSISNIKWQVITNIFTAAICDILK